MIYLITGGARSGKSSYAEALAKHTAKDVLYIATLEPSDEEMQGRITRHKSKRPETWRTVEIKFEMIKTILESAEKVILIDCLSGYVTNLVLRHEADGEDIVIDKTLEAVDELVGVIGQTDKTIIIVTNEVGYGVVPEYPLGRWFRDALGLANQRVAEVADTVVLVTVGIPQILKGKERSSFS
jgi:adenosyl cobinamide kinase/adenosyl cobinamide phosphate guanylyltransferase